MFVYTGLIYGVIVGDAVGIATSQMDQDECLFHYGRDKTLEYDVIIRDEHRVQWRPGDWTVHGDMSVRMYPRIPYDVWTYPDCTLYK